MLQQLRTVIRVFIFGFTNFCVSNRIGIKALNRVYNDLNYQQRYIFVQHVKQPPYSFDWQVKMLNGNIVKTHLDPDNPMTWQLALSYVEHDVGLCVIEHELNELHDSEVWYLDIGANLGLRSMPALSIGRPTIMFEPNPEICKLNQERCDLNDFKHYTIEQECLSNEKGTADFFISKSSYCSSLSQSNADIEGESTKVTVKVNRLDDYLKDKGINMSKNECIVKIDVEGFEWPVFQGGEDFFSNNSCSIIVEINSEDHNKTECYQMFNKLGYRFYAIVESVSNPIVKLSDERAFIESEANNYLFMSNEDFANSLEAKHLK